MNRLQKFEVGTRVSTVANNKKGFIRFIGDAQFASGEWIGVELDTADGKNDGSVSDVRYFICPKNHGLFVKRAQLRVDKEEIVSENKDKLAALREKRRAREAESTKESQNETDVSESVDSKVSAEESTDIGQDAEMNRAVPPLHQPSTASLPVDPKLTTPLRSGIKSTLTVIDATEAESDTQAGLLEALRRDRDKLRARVLELEQQLLTKDKEAIGTATPASAIKEKAAQSAQARRIAELEEQLAEFQQNMELLALDKEQVAMDLEEAQENVKSLESQLAQAQLKLSAGGSGGASAGDPENQVERLKEALLRLHQTSSTEAQGLRARLRELEGAEARAVEKAREVETLTAWQAQAKIRLEDLSLQVDEASGYEALLESLTERNLDLTTRNAQLLDTITDMEASQEIMEELDASQRDEIESLRKNLESLEFQNRGLHTQVDAKDAALQDSKRTQERLRTTIDDLKQENRNLASQVARVAAELEEVADRNKDALSQRRTLMSQTARARQLDLLLRRSEIAQRSAEAKAARLEALCPPLLASKELRLFQYESAVLRMLCRTCLAAEGLREELGGGGGIGGFLGERGVELMGDKAVRYVDSTTTLCVLVRALGLCWMAVDVLSHSSGLDQRSAGSSTAGDGVVNGVVESEADVGSALSSTVCPLLSDLDRALSPVLQRLESGEGVAGSGVVVAALTDTLTRCATAMNCLPDFEGLPVLQVAGVGGSTVGVSNAVTAISKCSTRQREVFVATQVLCWEGQLLGVVALTSVLETVCGGSVDGNKGDTAGTPDVVAASKDAAETLLSAIRGQYLGSDETTGFPSGGSKPGGKAEESSVLQQLNALLRQTGSEDNQSEETVNFVSTQSLSAISATALQSTISEFYGLIVADRNDLNTISSLKLSTSVQNNLMGLKQSMSIVLDEVIEAGAVANTRKVSAPNFLSGSWSWTWLVEGRGRDKSAASGATLSSSLSGGNVATATWRRRCRAQRAEVETQLVAADGMPVLQESLTKLKAEAEARAVELRCAIRRGDELGALTERQATALASAEVVAQREAERAKREIALEQEVRILSEALQVLESKLETAQTESKRMSSNALLSAVVSGSSGMEADGDTVSALALRGALLLGRTWRSLVIRRLADDLKPIPTSKIFSRTENITNRADSAPYGEGQLETKEGDNGDQAGKANTEGRMGDLCKIQRDIRLASASVRLVRLSSAATAAATATAGGISVKAGSVSAAVATQKLARARRAAALHSRLEALCGRDAQ